MGAALKQTQKTTGKEIHTDTNFYFRPETFRVGLRILFQPLKFRGRVIQGPKPPTLLFQGIACGKPNQVKLFAKVFGVDGERKSIRGKLFGENWDKCLAIRLACLGKWCCPTESKALGPDRFHRFARPT